MGVCSPEPCRWRPRSLESCDSPVDQATAVEASSAIGTSTRSASSSSASFLSSSTPTAETAGIPKLANCALGWSTVNHARSCASSQMSRPQRRVEHGAGIVAEHLLRDGDVAHQVGDAVASSRCELHHAVDVIAPVDEKPVRSHLGVQHLSPRPSSPRVARARRSPQRDSPAPPARNALELADAGHLDVQPSRGCRSRDSLPRRQVRRYRRPSLQSCDCLRLCSTYDRLEPAGCDWRADRAQTTKLARVDVVLDRVRDRGAALLVRGEPGIGKSALLDRARGRASALGARTLDDRWRRVRVRARLRRTAPVAGSRSPAGSTGLPDPQRQALDAAFGVNDLVEPDPFRVALAAYRLISDAADASRAAVDRRRRAMARPIERSTC